MDEHITPVGIRRAACPTHPGSSIRRWRADGPDGPGIYPQCTPGKGAPPHLLRWAEIQDVAAPHIDTSDLSASELDVLDDAASGLKINETAALRFKSSETVKAQRKSLMMKLGARTITQAVAITLIDRRDSSAGPV